MGQSSSREKILTFLTSKPVASSNDLARELRISEAGVRYHLKQLRQQGIIETAPTPEDAVRTAGRPYHYIRLCHIRHPDNLGNLARALLKILVVEYEDHDLWAALANHVVPQIEPDANLPRLLARLIRSLNEHHYQASWEAGKTGPRILFHNCPYAQVWNDFPSICKMDQLLVAKSLGLPFDQVRNIHQGSETTPACIFQSQKRAYSPIPSTQRNT